MIIDELELPEHVEELIRAAHHTVEFFPGDKFTKIPDSLNSKYLMLSFAEGMDIPNSCIWIEYEPNYQNAIDNIKREGMQVNLYQLLSNVLREVETIRCEAKIDDADPIIKNNKYEFIVEVPDLIKVILDTADHTVYHRIIQGAYYDRLQKS